MVYHTSTVKKKNDVRREKDLQTISLFSIELLILQENTTITKHPPSITDHFDESSKIAELCVCSHGDGSTGAGGALQCWQQRWAGRMICVSYYAQKNL